MPEAKAPAPIPYTPQLMTSLPGIARDGTRFGQRQHLDGRWMRFYGDKPRKMLGYREQLRNVAGLVRGMNVQTYDGATYVHVGTQAQLQRYTLDVATGLAGGIIDRTPAGFPPYATHNWQFALIYNTANNSNLLFAHAARSTANISNTEETLIYYSEVRANTPFIDIPGSWVSGGIVEMWPYLIRYGNDGQVAWPVPGNLTDLTGIGSGSARPWGTKVLKGLPLRGTSGPAVLLWHLDALTRMQFVGGTQIFQFDTITTSTALLSSQAVIEHAGIYYWATVSGWQIFNGTVRDLPNDTNRDFFLKSLNWAQRQKVFAFKIPRWNEIWWCYPRGDAEECNHAIIYNLKGFWFDTPLPWQGLTAGQYEQIFAYPIIASANRNEETLGRSMWQFDYGLNEVSGAVSTSKAIRSFFETHEFSYVEPSGPGAQGVNRALSTHIMEPDFNQEGDLLFQVVSRQNARAKFRVTDPILIKDNPAPNEQLTKLNHMGRLVAYRIESNERGGYYEGGSPMVHTKPGDGRMEDG